MAILLLPHQQPTKDVFSVTFVVGVKLGSWIVLGFVTFVVGVKLGSWIHYFLYPQLPLLSFLLPPLFHFLPLITFLPILPPLPILHPYFLMGH
jgi:hypothetical protein